MVEAVTDLEITKLCAEAANISVIIADHSRGVWYDENNNPRLYDPLHDDAQAMALVKQFNLGLDPLPERMGYIAWGGPFESRIRESDRDLNRAIATCVAKMQQAKHATA